MGEAGGCGELRNRIRESGRVVRPHGILRNNPSARASAMNALSPLRVLPLVLTLVLPLGAARAQEGNLRELIERELAAGAKEVSVPAGTYRLKRAPGPTPALLPLEGLRGVTLDLTGVRLLGEDLLPALWMENCEDTTVRGLTIDYDPLPFTQGTLVSVAEDRRSVEVEVHAGYPAAAMNAGGGPGGRIMFYAGGSATLKRGTRMTRPEAIEPLGGNRYRLRVIHKLWPAVAAGDGFSMTLPRKQPHAVQLEGGRGLTLENVTIHSSPMFAVLESHGNANTYRGVRIEPGPTPRGATRPRLRSANADGIHSKYTTVGPAVLGCHMEAQGDDAVAINGDYQLVVAAEGATLTLLGRPPAKQLVSPGEHVRVVSPGGSTEAAEVLGVELMDASGSPHADAVAAVLAGKAPALIRKPGWYTTLHRLTLDRPLAGSPGDYAFNADRQGDGYRVEDSTARNHRARGFVLKASRGRVVGNTIDGVALSGILILPGMKHWMESGFARDVVIEGNRVTDTGWMGFNNERNEAFAAIDVTSPLAWNPEAAHGGIVIRGNTVAGNGDAALRVDHAAGVQVRDNRFVVPAEGVRASSPRVLLAFDALRNVEASGNEVVIEGGTDAGSPLTIGDDVPDAEALRAGFELVPAPAEE